MTNEIREALLKDDIGTLRRLSKRRGKIGLEAKDALDKAFLKRKAVREQNKAIRFIFSKRLNS